MEICKFCRALVLNKADMITHLEWHEKEMTTINNIMTKFISFADSVNTSVRALTNGMMAITPSTVSTRAWWRNQK